MCVLGRLVQSLIYLTTDTCLTAYPGVTSLIPAQSHLFAEIVHEIISMATCFPFADSSRVVVSYKGKNVHKTG